MSYVHCVVLDCTYYLSFFTASLARLCRQGAVRLSNSLGFDLRTKSSRRSPLPEIIPTEGMVEAAFPISGVIDCIIPLISTQLSTNLRRHLPTDTIDMRFRHQMDTIDGERFLVQQDTGWRISWRSVFACIRLPSIHPLYEHAFSAGLFPLPWAMRSSSTSRNTLTTLERSSSLLSNEGTDTKRRTDLPRSGSSWGFSVDGRIFHRRDLGLWVNKGFI